MANVALQGFQPESRGGMTAEHVRKRVLTNNTTAIFKGDALDATTAGDVIVTATTNAARRIFSAKPMNCGLSNSSGP